MLLAVSDTIFTARTMSNKSFFEELRKRKVLQAAAIYFALAFGVVEVVVLIVEQLFLPQWVSTLAVILFVTGFPIAMFLSWTFDLTASGFQRTTIASRRGKASLVGAMTLLLAGTAGLFFLIRPDLQLQERPTRVTGTLANSVAIMPFDNTGQDPEDSYLSEGLSDNLRDQLGQLPDMRVAARSSSIVAREQGLDAVTIAERLGVANLVEGSIRRQGNSLRVSVQLIEGATGLSLLSRTFERGPRELLLVQNEIAAEIAAMMMPGTPPPVAKPATRDATANELMLLGRHYEMQVRDREEVDVDTLGKAIELYRQATEVDPEFALAYSRLADTLLYLGDIEQAEAPIFKAMSLNPELSEVQHTMGLYYWARGLPEAVQAFARAVELNPNNADALQYYGVSYWYGQDRRGQPEPFRRAVNVDPLTLSRHAALGDFYAKNGRVDETLEVIERIQELFVNDQSNKRVEAYRVIDFLLLQIGKVGEAIAWTIRARDLEPNNVDHVDRLAYLYAIIGDFDTALELEPEASLGILLRMRNYQALIDDAEYLMLDQPHDILVRYLLAFGHTAIGNYEDALRILDTTGQPGIVLNNAVRSSADVEAYYILVNAMHASGDLESARRLADRIRDPDIPGAIDWWYNFHESCGLAILGREDEAIDFLVKIEDSPQVPWESYLRDSVCMKLLEDTPEYQQVLDNVVSRKRTLRENLPQTLENFGVGL
jgi:TolB-like protein/tetratricopeptide (TPR) repeat protein